MIIIAEVRIWVRSRSRRLPMCNTNSNRNK